MLPLLSIIVLNMNVYDSRELPALFQKNHVLIGTFLCIRLEQPFLDLKVQLTAVPVTEKSLGNKRAS